MAVRSCQFGNVFNFASGVCSTNLNTKLFGKYTFIFKQLMPDN